VRWRAADAALFAIGGPHAVRSAQARRRVVQAA
jgi:hypothetical protein